MNYRHAYHAGNFADVLKHVVLALCLQHLRLKDTPFRVLDTHAGAGLFDLDGIEAGKTGEWRDGVGRILAADAPPPPPAIIDLLAPWLAAIVASNDGVADQWHRYPGSPAIAAHALRPQDKLVLSELHPSDRNSLSALFRRDEAVKVVELDGWMALRSFLPFPERRGLILIDPPYEERDELVRLPGRLAPALKRFANAMVIIWYPAKSPDAVEHLHREVQALGGLKILRADLSVGIAGDAPGLSGCGLLIINPPWTLPGQLRQLMPFLAERLAQGPDASWKVEAFGI